MPNQDGVQQQNAVAHFKFGIITVHDPSTGYAKVKIDENDDDEDGVFETDWLPVVVPFALDDKETWPVDVNTQVAVILDCNLEQGFIIGGLFNDEDTPPSGASSDLFKRLFKDGSFEQFNRSNGNKEVNYKGGLKTTCVNDSEFTVKNMKVQASQNIEHNAQQKVKANSTLGGSVEVGAKIKFANSAQDLKGILTDLVTALMAMTFTNSAGPTGPPNNIASLTPLIARLNALLE